MRLEGKNRGWRRRFGWKGSCGKAWRGSPRRYQLIILCRCYVAWNAKKFKKITKGKKKKRRNDISCNHVQQNKHSYLGHELTCEKGLV